MVRLVVKQLKNLFSFFSFLSIQLTVCLQTSNRVALSEQNFFGRLNKTSAPYLIDNFLILSAIGRNNYS